ncbi:MAG: hypothetical protein HW419_1822 [Deltaproteobacteria bacterium]|nr:hypothetical protein [Deltaproteobacteria bacterium]
MNAWESVFLQSPVNDGCYEEDELPQQNWDWPKGTWFQARLDHIRDHEPVLNRKSHRKISHAMELQTVQGAS